MLNEILNEINKNLNDLKILVFAFGENDKLKIYLNNKEIYHKQIKEDEALKILQEIGNKKIEHLIYYPIW